MMILCANIGKRHGLLPSEVMVSATLFDVMAHDLSGTWEEYSMADKKGRTEMYVKSMSQEDMLAMMARTKQ